MKIFAETERLLLREIVPDDALALFAIDSNPAVNTYLGNNPVKSLSQSKEIIEFIRKQYLENGIGRWAMIEKSTTTFIGWCGLKLVKEITNKHINYYDLGYRLNQKYWGLGFATEAALACISYGFSELKLNEIFAIADTQNKASKHVLEKVGFKLIESFDLEEIPHDWYELRKK